MEIVVIIIMLLVSLSFVLKLTFEAVPARFIVSLMAAAFVVWAVDIAVNQSKTQIADWLQNPDLMLDTAVLLTIDVFFQIAFCSLMTLRITGEKLSRTNHLLLTLTLYFPGLLIFPVLLSALVEMIFALPGTDFQLVGYMLGAAVLILPPLAAAGIKWLMPEKELRVEVIFMLNALIAMLGIVATVNGRTAAVGTNSVDFTALACVFGLLLAGCIAGFFIHKITLRKKLSHL